MDAGGFDVDGELARLFGDGVRPLHLEQALFDAVLRTTAAARLDAAGLPDRDSAVLRVPARSPLPVARDLHQPARGGAAADRR
jgi:hypothetical protein